MHFGDTDLLPDDTVLIRYDVPDDLRVEESQLADLPEDWRANDRVTRSIGSAWLDRVSACLLRVPSVIVRSYRSPTATTGTSSSTNHRHRDAAFITISRVERFVYDPRLLARFG